jgi:hypothetical protein
MIPLWLRLISIQTPFLDIDFKIERISSNFLDSSYYYYFFNKEKNILPYYEIKYTRRNYFYPEGRYFIYEHLCDSFLSFVEFLNGDSKGISLFFQRPLSFVKFNVNLMTIDNINYSSFTGFFINDNIFTGIKIIDRLNFLFFSKYFGISYNKENLLIYGLFRNVILSYSYNEDAICLYSYFYLREPVIISHFYIDTKKRFYISPVFLLDIDKSLYLLLSMETGIGFKSENISFETGYDFEKRLPYLISKIKFKEKFKFSSISLNIITNSDKNWISQMVISKRFYNGNIEPEIDLTRSKDNTILTIITRFYGLKIYYSIQMNQNHHFSQFWGARIKFID